MGETNSPSVAHVGYDISILSRVKLKNLTTRLTWRNIVTHGQLKENLYISNMGKFFGFNNNVTNLYNNSVVEKTNGMAFNQTTTLKLIYWFTYHQSIVHFKKMSSILYPYVPINLIYFVNCYSYTVIYKNNVIIILKE